MTRPRGIPLDSNQATFEAYEQRVEDAALDAYLDRYLEGDEPLPSDDYAGPHVEAAEPSPCDAFLGLQPCAGIQNGVCDQCRAVGRIDYDQLTQGGVS